MRLPSLGAPAAAVGVLHSLLPPQVALAVTDAATSTAVTPTFEPRGITPEDTIIFILGCVPFVWAGSERTWPAGASPFAMPFHDFFASFL